MSVAGGLAALAAVATLAFSPSNTAPERGRAAVTTQTSTTIVRGSAGKGSLVGKAFPSVSVIDLQARPLVVKAGTGRPTLVVFWSSECACDELYVAVDDLLAGMRASPKPPTAVGFSTDTDLSKAAQTAYSAGLAFPSAVDPGSVRSALGGDVDPGVLVLDDTLRIVGQFPRTVTSAQLSGFLRRQFG